MPPGSKVTIVAGAQVADDRDEPIDDLLLVGEGEASDRLRPAFHARVAVAQEDRLGDAERRHRAAKLVASQLGIHLPGTLLAALVPVRRADDPGRDARRGGQRHRPSGAEGLVVGVGEDRQEPARGGQRRTGLPVTGDRAPGER